MKRENIVDDLEITRLRLSIAIHSQGMGQDYWSLAGVRVRKEMRKRKEYYCLVNSL